MKQVKLEGLRFFQAIPESEREHIQPLIEVVELPKGEFLFKEGDTGRDLYFIVDGRIDVLLNLVDKSNFENRVSTIKEGDILGELSFLDGVVRSASAQARHDSILYKLPYEKATAYFDEHPAVGFSFIREIAKSLAQRVRTVNLMWRNSLPYIL